MSSGKIYGRDGPPQLHGRVEDIPHDILNEWIAAGAYWLRPRRPRHTGEWEKLVRCTCGCRDAFEVRSADSDEPGWVRGERFIGNYRCDLLCTTCGCDFILFDDGVHGYNAVICNDRSHLPADYAVANRALLKPLACACGGNLFAVIAGAIYDCADGIEETPESQWDDAYGSFEAAAKCSRCGMIHEIIAAETA